MSTLSIMAQPCAYAPAYTPAPAYEPAFQATKSGAIPVITDCHGRTVFMVYSLRWDLLMCLAKQSELDGNYIKAEEMLLQALTEVSRFNLIDSRVVQTVAQLADLYFHWGEIAEAIKYFRLQAHITHRVYGSNHTRSAESLSRLGTAYYADQSFPAAELCYKQALKIYSRHCGRRSKEATSAARNLVLVLEQSLQKAS